jgi:hypothetical protein
MKNFFELITSSINLITVAVVAKNMSPDPTEPLIGFSKKINNKNSLKLGFKKSHEKSQPAEIAALLASTPAGRLEIKITRSLELSRKMGNPNYYINGFYIYGTLPPGFVLSYDKQSDIVFLYVPNIHEAHYAKKDYGIDNSLIEQAVKGKLVTKIAAHKNMFGAAHYLAHLAKFDKQREQDIHAALTYLNNGKAHLASIHRGLSIIKNDAALHTKLIRPVIRNLTGLTKRAQNMLDGGSGLAPSEEVSKRPPLIQLPSAQPNLFTLAIMARPERAASLFNYVSFFYDMSSTNGVHKENSWYFNLAKSYFNQVDKVLGLRRTPNISQSLINDVATDLTNEDISPKTIGTYFRLDAGGFVGADFLSPVGGVWGQFRVFVSYDPSNPLYGRFHIRLLNYAGVAIPSGTVDAGLFQFTEYSFKYNMQTGRADDWMHTIGVYAFTEIAFPLSGQGAEPVIGRSYQDILSEANQNKWIASANWIGNKLNTVFKWLKVNISSGARQAISQLGRLGTKMEGDSEKLSKTFGPVDGQIGGYVGVSLTSNLSKKTDLGRLTQMAAEFGGALTGGAAGFALSYLTGIVASVPSTAMLTDAGGELGSFIGSLAYSAAARDGASLDLDWGALTWIGVRVPAGPASFGGYNQNNVFWSTNIATFN